MNIARFLSTFVIILGSFVLSSCLLPGMIPLNPEPIETAAPEPTESAEPPASAAPEGSMPAMETDPDVVLETLRGKDWVYLQALAEERYTDGESARPGTLSYTITINDDVPTLFNYGWCTTTEEILRQNFEHISVQLYFNDQELGSDVIHPFTFSTTDNMVCVSLGVLMSDWPSGEYQLRTVATFDEKVNDGVADYESGEYIHEYNVTVTR